MQLTQFTDLGLRVLMYLTQNEPQRMITNAEIAQQFSVPLNHLIKVVNKLAKLGWVEATRGRNGGLMLNIQPDQLTIATIILELEGNKPLIDCNANQCLLTGKCLLSDALHVAKQAFYEKLAKLTLHDICLGRTKTTIQKMHTNFLTG